MLFVLAIARVRVPSDSLSFRACVVGSGVTGTGSGSLRIGSDGAGLQSSEVAARAVQRVQNA